MRESLLRAKTARELEFLFEDKERNENVPGKGETEKAFGELVRLYEVARYAGTDTPERSRERISLEDVKRAEACRDMLLGKRKGKTDAAAYNKA